MVKKVLAKWQPVIEKKSGFNITNNHQIKTTTSRTVRNTTLLEELPFSLLDVKLASVLVSLLHHL